MRVALFIPCYIDQLKPEVGVASLDVLESLGFSVDFPTDQTCCGQPFLTAGETESARELGQRYVDVFDGYDAIVTPSGSCAATMRQHLPHLVPGSRAEQSAGRTFELCEFIHAQGTADRIRGTFPFRVGFHASCHGLRELRLGMPSESRRPTILDPARDLLRRLDDLSFSELERPDECCGFGGVFSIEEEAVSCRMGHDRLKDHDRAGSQVMTSIDASCLIHLEGLLRKNENPLRVLHVAEIFAEGMGLGHGRDQAGERLHGTR